MSAINFTFTATTPPTLPVLPPATLGAPPSGASVSLSGLKVPAYAPRYRQGTRRDFVRPAAPVYGTAVAAPGGSAGGSLGALPQLPAYVRAPAPGSSGVVVPAAPNVSPDAAPALGEILSLRSDIAVVTPGASTMPGAPGVPSLNTTVTAPTIDSPQGLMPLILNHSAIGEAARDLMVQARTEYLDRKAIQAEQGVMASLAAKGFSSPLGMATDAAIEITHETVLAKRKAAESVRDEALEMGRERLATAVAAAVEAEAKAQMSLLEVGKLLTEHDQQIVALAKEVLRELIDAYNARVDIINEVISEYQSYLDQVEAFNSGQSAINSINIAKTRNEAAKIDIFEGQLAAVGASYDINAENVEAQANKVREIRAYVDYAQAQARISREEIQAFEDIVRGYSQSFGVRSAQLQAYAAKVEAESSTSAVFSANASAFANFWRGEASRVQGEARYISESTQLYNVEIQNYSQYAQAFRAYVGSVSEAVNMSDSALRAWAQANQSAIRASSAYNRASAEWTSAHNAINLQRMDERNMRSMLWAQTRVLDRRIEGALRQAEAQTQAARAQAAYSVTSESARVNYSGQVALSGSSDRSLRNSMNYNRQWDVRTVDEESAV